jgi:cyclopropane fatty-acyl-phospholipid synthase-like methyltransferase
MTDSHRDTTKSHYESHSASSYEAAFFYEPGAYMNYLCRLVRDRLGLSTDISEKRRLLDIGGGTGNFTRLLVEGIAVEAVVVDPFLKASSVDDTDEQVRFVKAGAECFATPAENEWWRSDYHQVLMKEVIHHLDEKDRINIFSGMRQELQEMKDGELPSLLIITRPQHDHDYPLWLEARQVWAENQPPLSQIEGELKEAGFRSIQHSVEAYPCSTPLPRWFAMIQSRFWSTFSNFSDEELKEACERIKRDEKDRIDDKGDIHFEDRLLFITASK